MDLIHHLCPRAVRQEWEQEFPRPVGRPPLTLVSCTYVTFHCLSEDFNILLRAGKFFPYPRKPVFFETRQSIFKRESEDLVQVGFNTQANSGIAQHFYNRQFARECTRSSNVEELPPLSFSARSGTLLGWIYRLKTRISDRMKDSLEKTDLQAENHNSSLISGQGPSFYGIKMPCIQIFIRSKRRIRSFRRNRRISWNKRRIGIQRSKGELKPCIQ